MSINEDVSDSVHWHAIFVLLEFWRLSPRLSGVLESPEGGPIDPVFLHTEVICQCSYLKCACKLREARSLQIQWILGESPNRLGPLPSYPNLPNSSDLKAPGFTYFGRHKVSPAKSHLDGDAEVVPVLIYIQDIWKQKFWKGSSFLFGRLERFQTLQ